jgi:spermidine synthase
MKGTNMNQFTDLERFWKLAVVAIASGAIVMALEIAGSRIVTPVFGSTTYSWGILIGVVLSGLTIGYHLGGRVSNNSPNFGKLCSIAFSTGVFIVCIPFVAQETIELFTSVFPDSITANLFVTLALFCPPSILAGFVSPYAIKLGTKSLHKVGNISGNLYSLSTLGSIFGTFFTVFVLIPLFEINYMILGIGVSLMLISVIGLKLAPKIILGLFVSLLVANYVIGGTDATQHNGDLYEKESLYSTIRVTEYDGFRTLYVDGTVHSIMNVNDPDGLELYYTKLFHIASAINPQIENALFIGGGGFSGPKNFLAMHPEIKVDVVEIDPDIVTVAKKYFALHNHPGLTVYTEDARQFLMRVEKKYDAIILDAYTGNNIPFHLLTLEYYTLLNERLDEDGVIISNFIGVLEGRNAQLLNANYKTMREVFPAVYTFPTNVNSKDYRQNIAVVAFKTEYDLLGKLSESSSCIIYRDITCSDVVENHHTPAVTDDTPFLTDQFSPVDHLAGYYVQTPAVQHRQPQQDALGFDVFVRIGIAALIVVWAFSARQIWQRKTMGPVGFEPTISSTPG